jgi:hypothetical protein
MIEKALTILLWGFHRGSIWRAAANPIGRAEHVAVRFVGKLQQQISFDAVWLGKGDTLMFFEVTATPQRNQSGP